ncbi:MAG: hypothetical protein ACRDLO_07175 [Solirubrobacterales bacterium]
MTTTKRAAIVVALAVALALPATAMAGRTVHKLSGPVTGDPNGKVSIEVVVKNGKPQKLRRLTYENLDAHCNVDGTTIVPAGELSGNAGRNLAGFQDPQHSLFQWFSFPNDGAREVDARGRVKERGKKVVGEIDVYDNNACAASTKNKFTVTK